MSPAPEGRPCRDKKATGLKGQKGAKSGNDQSDNGASIKPDPFIQSTKVLGLQSTNFLSFLRKKDIAMVMFYEKNDTQSKWSRQHFKRAAENTKRAGHGYAAVDCSQDPDFCIENDVPQIPHFQLFSRGENLPYFTVNAPQFFYEDMKMWMESHPAGSADG